MKKISRLFVFCGLLPIAAVAQQGSKFSDSLRLNAVEIYERKIQLSEYNRNKNIQILNSEMLMALPGSSIQEKLANINGVDIRQRGAFGAQSDISIDGGNFEQTQVLINGMKISDVQTGHHSLNIPIPLEAIAQIEVLRGPAARIYGVNSLTGAVNIVTKKKTEDQLFAQITAGSSFRNNEEQSSGKYYGYGMQLGGHISRAKHQHQLYLARDWSNGYRYNTGNEKYQLWYQSDVQFDTSNQASVYGGYISNKFGTNGYYAAPGDKESDERVNTFFAALKTQHLLSEKWLMTPSISFRNNTDDYRYYRDNLDVARSQHETQVFSADLNNSVELNFATLKFGAEYRFENIESSNIGDHRRQNMGAFAELGKDFGALSVNVGSYVNYNSIYGWQVYPGIDLGYQFLPNLKLMANAGSSQRLPSFTELYLNQKGNVGNPDVRPEEGWQAEMGIKYQEGLFNIYGGAFYKEISNFIDWVRNDISLPWQSINFSKNKVKGLTLQTAYDFALSGNATLKTKLAYTYLSPSFKQSSEANILSKYAIESLRNQLIFNLGYSYKDFSIYSSNRFQERVAYKSYMLNDIKASYQFKQFNWFAEANNIFDKQYIEAGAAFMPGAWFNMGLKMNLK